MKKPIEAGVSATPEAPAPDESWRNLPNRAWFFMDSPNCLQRYSVQEKNGGECSIVCSTPYHHEGAKKDMQEIARLHNESMGVAAGEPAPPTRTAKDYAIEFGEYLAKAAEHFMDEQNKWDMAEVSGGETDCDARSDAWLSLRSAIGEFRKRAVRASLSGSATTPLEAGYVREVRPFQLPNCDVCGAEMVPTGYKCLSCKAVSGSATPEYRCDACGDLMELGPCDATVIHVKPCEHASVPDDNDHLRSDALRDADE